MKIAWVTPSLHTGLGVYTKIATVALKEFFSIEVLCPPFESLSVLNKFDLVIYNLGNSSDNLPVYLALRVHPGVVVLHDRTYHHFFAFYYLDYLKNREAYYYALRHLYGEEALSLAQEFFQSGGSLWESPYCIPYSMREHFYPHALAIIVHASDYYQILKEEFWGPLLYVPFPFQPGSPPLQSSKKNKGLPEDKIIFFSYGFLSKNRMIEEIIKILGESPQLKERVIYLIGGQVDPNYLKNLQYLVELYGLKKNISFLGYLKEKELYEYLSLADLCINLRRYTTEGASWSLLEQLAFKKPCLVSDLGFYKTLPDHILIKTNNQPEDIKEKLLQFLRERENFKLMGEKAFIFLRDNFSPERYAYTLKKFLEEKLDNLFQKLILRNTLKDLKSKMPNLSQYSSLCKAYNNLLAKLMTRIWKEG